MILVDQNDLPLGTAGKLDAHKRGLRHRAISVFVRDSAGKLLLQRRHPDKYHSGGLWTNTCCTHPRPGEGTAAAARRRLAEEMGVRCTIDPMFMTEYRADVSNGLVENEIVHVFGGVYDGPVAPDLSELTEWKWLTLEELIASQESCPHVYSVWLLHYMSKYQDIVERWLK